jgi:peptide/nickel transport system permease protein
MSIQIPVLELESDEVRELGQQLPEPSQSRWTTLRSYTPSWIAPLFQSKKAILGMTILAIYIALALLAPVISPGDPKEFVGRPHQPPSREFWLGTTGLGRDVWAQTIWGARFTLQIGFMVGSATTIVGCLVGMTAGYFRGPIDDFLSLLTNVFLIIPTIPLLVVLAAFVGSKDLLYFVAVLTLTGWAWPARVIRSQTLSLREKDFVAASVVVGEKGWRIIFREILPNMLSIIVASLIGSTIFAIGAQAALEFLGLGNPGQVSWGTNLYWAQNDAGLLTGAWWTFLPAGVCIALVAFAFAMINYGIDEITNPRLRARSGIDKVLKQRNVRTTGTRATPVLQKQGTPVVAQRSAS